MPNPDEQQALGLDYPAMRGWWIRRVLKFRTRDVEPEPGVLDVADDEDG